MRGNMSNADKAAGIFKEGFSCSMAVLGTYCEQFGLDKKQAYKISSGFGGGGYYREQKTSKK